MRLGEVPFVPDIEQVLDAVEVEKERVAAAAGEKSVGPDLMIFGLAPKETSASATIFVPTASAERDCAPVARNTLTVCLPFCGFENT
jgi:hypothetical protein